MPTLRRLARNVFAFVVLAALAVPVAAAAYAAVIVLQLAGDGALMLAGLAQGPTPGAWFLGAVIAYPMARLVDRELARCEGT